MTANTILLDFTLKSTNASKDAVDAAAFKVLSSYLSNFTKSYEMELSDGGSVILYSADKGVFVTVRLFISGLVTVNIEYFKSDCDPPLLTYQSSRNMEEALGKALSVSSSSLIPPIRRHGLPTYFPSSDERILEYDIDKLVFEEISKFQKVQIVHSRTLGNMLVLDGLQNLSDRDLIYTETLMQRGVENYNGKEIVILGGGDGALLHELLKENPAFVVMLEIDDVVIDACRKHLRECCGDTLDSMKGDNYEIIIGDCMDSLQQYVKEGRQFDYVFGDLTDAPISSSPQEQEMWDFIKKIINTSLKILKPEGKYMTHCCGTSSPNVLKNYENLLTQLDLPVDFCKSNAFVPSFLEDWIFYHITIRH